FSRFTLANFFGVEPLGLTVGAAPPFNPPNLPTSQNSFSRNLAIGWTHTFSPNTLNDFRFGFNRARMPREQRGPDFFGTFNIPGSNRDEADLGLPAVTVTGLSQFGGTDSITPFLLTENDFQFIDEMSLVTGSHTWRIGGSFIRT